MRYSKFLITFFIAFSVNCLGETLNESQATQLLANKINNSKAYALWTKPECLLFATEQKNKKFFDFVVQEKHNAECGGDPLTQPPIDRFRVYRANHKVYWNNLSSDNLMTFNQFLKSRNVKSSK